jgi:lysozyme family protein
VTPFEASFAFVAGVEGGFSSDPCDPGNWTGGRVGAGVCRGTRWGISASAFPTLDIPNVTADQARDLYQAHYWVPSGCPVLPPPLALVVFDSAVNSGVSRAVQWLQAALGVPQDGTCGPETLRQVARSVPLTLAAEVIARRTDALALSPGWSRFGLGWARRLANLAFGAAVLNASAPAPAAE